MNERHRISLRESAPGSPPDILDRVKDAIDELFDYGVSAAGNYVKGKGAPLFIGLQWTFTESSLI